MQTTCKHTNSNTTCKQTDVVSLYCICNNGSKYVYM